MITAYTVVKNFEESLCEYTGAKYCVTTDSCSNAIKIALHWWKDNHPGKTVSMPYRTYPSVPCSAIHCGFKVKFNHYLWIGAYQIKPTNIWDSAKRFKRGMYVNGEIQCISFHGKKYLPIGRGGAILTNSFLVCLGFTILMCCRHLDWST